MIPRGSHPARPILRRPTSRLRTEQGHGTSAATEGGRWKRSSLGPKSSENLVKGSAELQVAWGRLTTPHASTEQQLLITLPPPFGVEQFSHRGIVQCRDQLRRAGLPLNARKDQRQGLFQSRIPRNIANQFELSIVAALSQPQASSQNGFTGHQHTAARPTSIQQVQPVPIRDLPQMTETATLLDRPEPLGMAAVDRPPGQPKG